MMSRSPKRGCKRAQNEHVQTDSVGVQWQQDGSTAPAPSSGVPGEPHAKRGTRSRAAADTSSRAVPPPSVQASRRPSTRKRLPVEPRAGADHHSNWTRVPVRRVAGDDLARLQPRRRGQARLGDDPARVRIRGRLAKFRALLRQALGGHAAGPGIQTAATRRRPRGRHGRGSRPEGTTGAPLVA